MITKPSIITAVTLAIALTGFSVEAKDARHCPPGLAKKEVPCVPPGQAKKGNKHAHDDWRHGDRVYGDYVLIPRSDWERLKLRDYRDGSTYLTVDSQILRVARDTLIVLEAVRILDRALD
ncbi:excinuclease ABC subunit A [Rhodobacter sp. SY28-1]|uniref:excinuclease ABC subunit A n=1 Tax=Rhodobacter sp. SY28-1 TaxID=2562317 RepID=UPI0010C0C4D1|nr:excinuclease ABC subunit A [Rhodobacter sp. SY28-1]